MGDGESDLERSRFSWSSPALTPRVDEWMFSLDLAIVHNWLKFSQIYELKFQVFNYLAVATLSKTAPHNPLVVLFFFFFYHAKPC